MTAVNKSILIPLEKYKRLLANREEVRENNVKESPQILHQTEQCQDGSGDEKNPESKWLLGIPSLFKRNVQAILDHLRDHKNTLSWNDRGEIVYKGRTILGSSLTDLLKDSQRHYKTLDPYGDREFYRAWAAMNIPEGLLGNERRKEEVRRYKNHPEEGYIPPPPGVPQKLAPKKLKRKETKDKLKWLSL